MVREEKYFQINISSNFQITNTSLNPKISEIMNLKPNYIAAEKHESYLQCIDHEAKAKILPYRAQGEAFSRESSVVKSYDDETYAEAYSEVIKLKLKGQNIQNRDVLGFIANRSYGSAILNKKNLSHLK